MTGLATCWSLTPDGIGAALVEVEAHVARGLPSLGVIGLPGASIGESRWRVRSAIAMSGLRWPEGRITVGLSPADLPKNGTGLDLAIALALLAADGTIPEVGEDTAVIGELGLDGQVRGVRTALAMALQAQASGFRRLVLAAVNSGQASEVPDLSVVGVESLQQAIAVLRGTDPGAQVERRSPPGSNGANESSGEAKDLCDVRGQSTARFALEVIAVGGHHGLLVGEAGSGKTMLAERLSGIMSPLTAREALEVTSIHAATHPVGDDELLQERPFVAPHHSATVPALIGSMRGTLARPGAVTLAHRGVLFLDEAPEFARPCLEALREPLESQSVVIARAGGTVHMPAACQVLLAANPCPCGIPAGRDSRCECSPMARRRYSERLSGPFLDRIDVRVPVERPSRADLRGPMPESTSMVRERVLLARDRMLTRTNGVENARIPGSRLRSDLAPDPSGMRVLEAIAFEGPRGLDRILRLSWTLADLDGRDRPGEEAVTAAAMLRSGAGA